MPVMLLRDQQKAFLNGMEQQRAFLNGVAIWEKPVAAPVSIFSLTTIHAGKNGFNVSNQSDTTINLDRTSTSRSWISWSVSWPVGSRIVFDWSTLNAATGVWASLDDVLGLSSPTHDILRNVSGGSGHVDFTIPSGGFAYFGFRISNGQATSLLSITNFSVYAP